MKVVDIKTRELNAIQREAINEAVNENIAMHLSYQVVENDNLVEVGTDGSRTIVGQSKFKTVELSFTTRDFILSE